MSSFKQLKVKRDAQRPIFAPSIKRTDQPVSANVPKTLINDFHSRPETVAGPSTSPSLSSLLIPPTATQGTLEANHNVQIRKTNTRGRGLFWCPQDDRRLGRGTTILRLTPEVTVPSSDNLGTLCHSCFSAAGKDGQALQRCSGCKTLRYCSLSCQKSDWPSHRSECKALQHFQKKSRKNNDVEESKDPGMMLRLMGRLVWERKRLGSSWWKRIEALQADRETVIHDSTLLSFPIRLAQYLGADNDSQSGDGNMKSMGFANAGDILDLIGRTNINTFVAYSSDLTAIGVALSTTAAMINHSCSPNTAIVYPNGPGATNPMHVVAIRDIEPDEELTTFYIDVSDPYISRQKVLQQRYSFRCDCLLCSKAEKSVQNGGKAKVDAREALWCGRLGCSGWVAFANGGFVGTCNSCRQPASIDPAEVTAAREEGIKLLERVDRFISAGKAKEALSSAGRTMKELTRIQPPSSYPLLSLLRQLQTALILCATSASDPKEVMTYFEEAIRFHFLSLAGMQASKGSVFVEGHPSRAITMATLSTLLVREVTAEEADWCTAMPATSEYLSRVPSLPPMGQARDQAGVSLMLQAINELKIAYGNEEEGGEPGRKLIVQVREWQEATQAALSLPRR